MSRSRWKAVLPFTFLLMFLLAACGGSSTSQAPTKPTPTPSPAPAQGQQLLAKAAQTLKTAKTLHAIFNLTAAGSAFNGTVKTEVWNMYPDKSRSVVLQSTIRQLSRGTVTVSNGKQLWQYDPAKKVVYTGQVSDNTGTPTTGASRDQNQFIMNIVQSVLTRSNATLISSSASINGHDAYDVHVVSPAPGSGQPGSAGTGSNSGNFNYDGHVYIDKTSSLPVQVKLTIQGFGQVALDVPTLVLNQPLDNSLFTFVPPPGVQVLPFPKTGTTKTGSITLAEAERQAGYHLLSIPTSHTEYQLRGVDALGAPGNQIFTLNYVKSNSSFAISEGKSLANLPGSGQQISLRGTTATLSSVGSTMTLTWTEKGVGIQIAGNLSKNEIVAIANLLS
jgi:outer membrane lipoprotein-sorting protein